MSNPTKLPAWQALEAHQKEMAAVQMRDLFQKDPKRFDKFSLRFNDILLDYSKNRVTEKTMGLLLDLARQSDLEAWRDRMCSGQKINTTEDRAVLHIRSEER